MNNNTFCCRTTNYTKRVFLICFEIRPKPFSNKFQTPITLNLFIFLLYANLLKLDGSPRKLHENIRLRHKLIKLVTILVRGAPYKLRLLLLLGKALFEIAQALRNSYHENKWKWNGWILFWSVYVFLQKAFNGNWLPGGKLKIRNSLRGLTNLFQVFFLTRLNTSIFLIEQTFA